MKTFLLLFCSITIFGAGCGSVQYPAHEVGAPASTTQQQAPQTKTMDLSGRRLATLPMDIFSRTDLTHLDLSNNLLTDAPPSQIGQLQNLISLDVSHNALTGLPAELGQLRKLEVLDVSNNQLTGLPMELGRLTQLRILDISGNPYSTQDLDAIAKQLPQTDIRR